MKLYEEKENYDVMINAANIESKYYGIMTRVEETVKFAKRIGFEKIGITCKAGAIKKDRVGINESCKKVGVNMCNLIYQAEKLKYK